MSNNNILLKKVPDRLTNVLKGVGVIIVAAIISLIIWFVIMFGSFGGDVQGPVQSLSITAWLVSGIVFVVSLVKAINIILRPIKKS